MTAVGAVQCDPGVAPDSGGHPADTAGLTLKEHHVTSPTAPPLDTRLSRWVRAVPILAAFIVGAASFTLSFFAQSEVAAAVGAVPGRLAWLVPIAIDGGVLAGSASLWSSATRGSRKDPVAYLTILALLCLSVVINVHHAALDGGLLASVIAGAPPVILLLCLELVASQARRDAFDRISEPDLDTCNVSQPAGAPQGIVPAPWTGWTPPVISRPPTSRRREEPTSQPAAKPRTRAAGPSRAERIRVAFADHVACGGDPNDPALVRNLAARFDAPAASVRKTLGEVRRAQAPA